MEQAVKEKIEKFFKQYPQKTYKKGEVILNRFDTPKGVYLVSSGIVRMYGNSKEGVETTINVFKPISFFPVGWAINNSKNNHYYDALSDSKLYIAPRDHFIDFIKSEHDIAFNLLQRIYRGLDGYFMLIESLLSDDAYHKTITQLLIHTKRFGEELGSSNAYNLKLTQSQLGSLTGLSREAVTREIKKLQEKKIVMYAKDTLRILDLQKLEDELA